MEYTIVSDNSDHRYIIPFEQLGDWNEWRNIPEDDERAWDAPEYAERIDGERIIFGEYRIG